MSNNYNDDDLNDFNDNDDILKDDGFIDSDDNFPDEDYIDEDDADAVFDRNEKAKKRSDIIRRIILVISVGVFIFAAYNLINIFLAYHKADVIYDNIQQDVLDEDSHTKVVIGEDEQEVEIPFTYNHQALLNINSQGIGYIYIPSIDCRLPMVQGDDNDYYLTHTFNKEYSANGCLFEDYRINGGLSASQIIIYGHNMRNGAMFGKLKNYQDYSFWNNSGNDVFYIYTGNVIKEYKIFSCYISEAISDTYTFNFPTLESMRDYAVNMKAKSMYDTGVDVSTATQVITLSTCTNDGEQRFIVHGMYVGEASLE
uniref:class B sortase n=1 Tax=Lachnospira sp. TaxID=2049031 RepID=UPI0040275A64